MDKIPQILDSGEKLKYRISAMGLAIIAMTPILISPPAFFVLDLDIGVLNYLIDPWIFLGLGVFFIMFRFISVLEIDNEGIRLYRVNVMKWDEVVSAKKSNIFGLMYMRVTRRKGMDMWVPLYFKGYPPIEDVLKEKSLPGNPIHQLFASYSQNP